MPLPVNPWRIFVTGATGPLGTSVIHALLAAGAEVTALVPYQAYLRLDSAGGRVQLVEGDAWNPGTLVGRSRGHGTVIHLVGSLRQQPERGLTYDYLNLTALRNITRMATQDGVQHFIYLSAAWAPWMPGGYLASKRRAEGYVQRSGIPWTILRAPLVYPRGYLQNPLLLVVGGLGQVPLLGWPVSRWGPLAMDTVGQAVARIALMPGPRGRILYARDLRRLSQAASRRDDDRWLEGL